MMKHSSLLSLLLAAACMMAAAGPVFAEQYVPKYTGARKVKVAKGKLYVDGREFYVNGAAATMKYELMGQYGANVCRVYTAGKYTLKLIDRLHENGLMLFVGLSSPNYSTFKKGEPTYEDEDFRRQLIAKNIEVVKTLKDHPAVLCWCLGNELEGSGHSRYEGLYRYYGELAREIRKIDRNHPITAAFTEKPIQAECDLVNQFCPDLDFVCFNSYLSFLESHSNDSDLNYTEHLRELGWKKPFMITEYGPTGTWNRAELKSEGRINDWGALIQLSSEEAGQAYVKCYNLIKSYKNCLGGVAFWWGFQSHGQVLGWYPLMTREHYMLSAVEALESCWRGIPYEPKSPLVRSWKSSITLNGRTADGDEGLVDRNPVLSAGQNCTACVEALCRSGHPESIVYKWFIYRDSNYTHRKGDTEWISVKWDKCESSYVPIGGRSAMNEDAGADLFVDRTLPEVSFTAPSQAGNYRLYVIVKDESNKTAGSACLNFRVE